MKEEEEGVKRIEFKITVSSIFSEIQELSGKIADIQAKISDIQAVQKDKDQTAEQVKFRGDLREVYLMGFWREQAQSRYPDLKNLGKQFA